MNLEELATKVPEKFRPIVQEYGPAFIAMGEEDIVAWINLLAKGRIDEAYRALLEKLPNQDLLAEWTKLNAEWQAANVEEARRRTVVQEATAAILKVLLAIALAAVGL